MSIAEVREELANAVGSIEGLRGSPYMTDQVNPPQAMVDFEVNYDLVFSRGADAYDFTVWVFAERTSERTSQMLLDDLRDPSSDKSLKNAIESWAALDGAENPGAVCDYAHVVSATAIREVPVGTMTYLTVEFHVEVVIRP